MASDALEREMTISTGPFIRPPHYCAQLPSYHDDDDDDADGDDDDDDGDDDEDDDDGEDDHLHRAIHSYCAQHPSYHDDDDGYPACSCHGEFFLFSTENVPISQYYQFGESKYIHLDNYQFPKK